MKFFSSSTVRHLVMFSLTLVLLVAVGGCDESAPDADSVLAPHEAVEVAMSHEHDAEGETCFICDASKRTEGRLWCNEHDRYEDRCWLCHPEIEDKDRLYCKEHSLYEDECFLCHPEINANEGAIE